MEKKTTLVVVDFQYDFCLLGAPLYVPGSDKALWNISHLIENKKVDRVIFTADWHPANHCSFKRNGGEWNDHCVQFSKGAAIHDLLLYGCIGAGIPYEVLTKGVLPSSEEYGVKVAPATIRVNYHTIYSHSMGIDIREYCRGRIRCAFGIGTNLTNDTGHKPSNIVMKLTSCQMNKNQPVFNCVKLSDDLGKHTGLEQEVEHCMNELGL